jgi:hypothetical protein
MAIDQKAYNYSMGVATLRTLINALNKKNPTWTMDTLVKFLHVNQTDKTNPLTEEAYKHFVESLGAYKQSFTKLGKSASSWDELWQDLADRTPKGLMPTWSAIHKITGNPETFKTTVLEKISNTGSAVGKASVKVQSSIGNTFDFFGNTKYLLLAGVLGVVAYKLLGQSDKISKAYNTVKGDAGKLYEKAKSEGVKGIAFAKSQYKK